MTEQAQPAGNSGYWRLALWGLAAALLLTPLVAMQFTAEIRWGPADFLVAGSLLGGLGLAVELAARRTRNLAYRAGAALAALTAFALVWITLAVGIIGDEGNPANLLFAGVLAVALLGALIARFRPPGMALAMAGAAIAQLLVAAIASVGTEAPPSEIGLILAFAAPWALAAGLFHKAGRS